MARISSVIGFLFISLSLSCEENKGNEFETWEISFDAPDDAVETEDNYEFGDFSDACLIPWCPDAQEIEETEAADGWEAQIDTEDEHYDVSDGQELQEISSIKCGVIDAEFPEFDKSCEKDEDCVLVYHQINCCGTLVAWGLNAFEKTAFEYAESVCQSQYPPCGCAQAPTMAEDLNTAFSEEDFSVKCTQEKCRSYVKGKVPKCRDSNDCDNFQMCLAPGEKLPCGICFQPEETCVSDAGCGDAKVCEWIASGWG
ncbi:MAG: hypothetical protein FJ088_15900, partial [Deltaproteobacteria bacterium]|nr:hypothetical protein [Deltaproteobacteria bacterium]